MNNISVPITINEKIKYVNETVYNVNDFPYKELCCKKLIKKNNGKNSKYYYDIVSTFDIECTTIEPPYTLNKKGHKVYEYTPYGFMYHWQWCVGGYVCFGRTWEEFLIFVDKISEILDLKVNKCLVVYVHFLSYEFQFIKDFFNIVSVFAREERKPIKFNTSNGFEFRCSYFLSNMSLAKFCENTQNVTHWKMSGDEYEYNKIRTPYTPMTEKELGYCYNDVMGLYECIKELLKDDTLATIPLTNTGYVRREFRSVMQNEKCRRQFEKLSLDLPQYEMCKNAFRGGNVHANRFLTNKVLKNIKSFDIQSSYPAVINTEYYPVGKFMWANLNKSNIDYYLNNYCVIMFVALKNVCIKKDVVIPYIDKGHCIDITKKHTIDNGRVLQADCLTIYLTEIDFKIIKNTYNFSNYKVIKAMYSERGKLPLELREKMLEYYDNKTKLKGVEGKEYEYLKSKNRLNSTFGCMVTDITSDDIKYSCDNGWETVSVNKEEALEKYYNSRNSFLSYQWGVYVTAHARNHLQILLDKVGMDVVYCDTDSVKFCNVETNTKYFEEENKKLINVSYNNDVRNFSEKDNKKYILGVWDDDGFYDEFKTLGSKKYCYTDKKGFHVTVAGMNKKKGAERVGNVNKFNIGTTFSDVGRTTSWYNDETIHSITVNGDTFTTASNIAVIETTYTLGVTDSYFEVLQNPYLYLDI